MKEEILRRRAIFKGFVKRELHDNLSSDITHNQYKVNCLNNIMAVHDANIKALLEKMADICGDDAHTNYDGFDVDEEGNYRYWYNKEQVYNFINLLK